MQLSKPMPKDAPHNRPDDPPGRGDTLCVEAVMTKDVWTCTAHDTLEHAARLMWDRDCGVIPVVDRDRRVVGMITDRDVCMAAYIQGKPLVHLRVGDVMSRHVHAVHPDDSVVHAEHLMSDFQVRRLPVNDASGYLLGLVSLVDLARHVHPLGPHVVGESGDERIARTLAGIGVPHGRRVPAGES